MSDPLQRDVPLKMERKDAKRLLSRLYENRYDDVEETPVTLQVPTGETIEQLESKYPLVASSFDHND